ncbi:GPI anchored cell wall protein [Aspergillus arachidicola]|uniref:GPI anchored cell wall protein n=1 Tax=Aspergillus arachidicola TaxID=656916 RepID=A0A2G7GBX2_9EURO|nr:GPI anchored cell wall protein [Aspergillus arachidicola]
MKNFATVAALAAGANAFVGRSNNCCFHLTASGGDSGTVGQLDDGQNRIHGGLQEAEFCIDSKGALTDGNGRGCIITGPTTQFQCDEGATPMTGWSIDSQGQVSYNGDADFVACATGQNGGLNIYTTGSSDVTGCKDIKLSADSCSSSVSGSSSVAVPGSSTPAPGPSSSASVPYVPGPSSSASVPYVPGSSGSAVTLQTTVTSTYCPESSTVPVIPGTPGTPGVPGTSATPGVPGTSSVPVIPVTSGTPGVPGTSGGQPSQTASSAQPSGTSTAGGSCPTDLSGEYEFPHLIIPIDSSSPDTAAGTSYNGTISSTVSTIFNFDIPSSDAGKTCSLVFLFPKKEDLETSSYSFSGDGKVDFASLQSAATQSTTYNNAPAVKEDYGDFTISPGNSYLISTFECPAGQAVSYEMKNSGSTELDFFEDYNPSPLGLYITDRLWEFNCGFLGLLLSQGLAFLITQVLKNACGKPRPDIIDRCQPRPGSEDPFRGLSNYTICTGDPAIIKDGFRSWPSGHSSSSFAGLFYLTLWLCGKLHFMDNRGEVWKAIIIIIPCIGATLIAVSRIMDARHHPFDVITGSLLGIVCAYIAYRQYFPSITEPWKKGRAYPIRSWGRDPVVPSDAAPLVTTNESTVALRNPEEERLNASGVPDTRDATQLRASRYMPPSNNPYATNMYGRDDDGHWSSSSEDVADGYEMQHGYARTQNPTYGGQLPRYETDTSYHSQMQPPVTGVSASHPPPITTIRSDGGRELTDVPPRAL